MLKRNQVEDILKCCNSDIPRCHNCGLRKECDDSEEFFRKELAETALHYMNEFEKAPIPGQISFFEEDAKC